MSKYIRFTLGQFQSNMYGILKESKAGFMTDITAEWKLLYKEKEVREHIYSISTKNPSVKILIFSSVDLKTGKMRDCGDDAVRLVFQWKTKNGFMYKRINKHLRIISLFNNIVTARA